MLARVASMGRCAVRILANPATGRRGLLVVALLTLRVGMLARFASMGRCASEFWRIRLPGEAGIVGGGLAYAAGWDARSRCEHGTVCGPNSGESGYGEAPVVLWP
jgi:hypothetical protein